MKKNLPAPEAKAGKPRSARPRDAAATKATILDCAVREFAERGYDGTSIEEIAQRANVSKPVVYEHFGGKEGLYAVVVELAQNDTIIRKPSKKWGQETDLIAHGSNLS